MSRAPTTVPGPQQLFMDEMSGWALPSAWCSVDEGARTSHQLCVLHSAKFSCVSRCLLTSPCQLCETAPLVSPFCQGKWKPEGLCVAVTVTVGLGCGPLCLTLSSRSVPGKCWQGRRQVVAFGPSSGVRQVYIPNSHSGKTQILWAWGEGTREGPAWAGVLRGPSCSNPVFSEREGRLSPSNSL